MPMVRWVMVCWEETGQEGEEREGRSQLSSFVSSSSLEGGSCVTTYVLWG